MTAIEYEGQLGAVPGKYAVAVSRYNENVTGKLLEGAVATLRQHGVADEDLLVAWVPGAWELPVAAQRLAEVSGCRAVMCLGAVIKGETSHDQYINQQVSDSLGRLALAHRLPVLFGLLTVDSLEQALSRAGGRMGNKGAECAEAALRMASLLTQLPPAEPL